MSRAVRPVEPASVLVVTTAQVQPTPAAVTRLERTYALRSALDPAWAARPIELLRHRGRAMLLIEDPGGELLVRLLDSSWDLAQFLRVTVGLTSALGDLHRAGLVHKEVTPAKVLANVFTSEANG